MGLEKITTAVACCATQGVLMPVCIEKDHLVNTLEKFAMRIPSQICPKNEWGYCTRFVVQIEPETEQLFTGS